MKSEIGIDTLIDTERMQQEIDQMQRTLQNLEMRLRHPWLAKSRLLLWVIEKWIAYRVRRIVHLKKIR